MFHIALFSPQIPPNTGNIIRLCANNSCQLHLIKPLGFELSEKSLRRAGLDYHDMANITLHENLDEYLQSIINNRFFAITKFGKSRYDKADFQHGDHLLFGSEISGLPSEFLQSLPDEKTLYIPMCAGNRSLNLSNAVALVSYEAWRHIDYAIN